MKKVKLPIEGIDFTTLGVTLALLVLGVLSIYSSGVTAEGALVSREYIKQIIWALTGLVLMALVALADLKRAKDYSVFVYVALLLLLLYTRLFGRVVNGARSWIGIGEFGIQPSEFMKIATILFLAQYLSGSEHTAPLRRLAISFAIVLVPIMLVLSQPDFGTALVFFPIFLFMIFIAGLDRRYILFILCWIFSTFAFMVLPLFDKFRNRPPSSIVFVLFRTPYIYFLLGTAVVILLLSTWGWISSKRKYYYWVAFIALIFALSLASATLAQRVLKEYQLMRLLVFLDPSIDPRGSGWNILQSITAIGSGGFFGKGFLQGTQSHYRYLPQQSTDFIFSIIAEEWGLVGCLAIFSLFLVLFRRCIILLRTAKDPFSEFVVAGIFGMLLFHFMINTGMAMGIMPITGIPLFFLSYGGSSLWAVMIAIGILLGIFARRYST